MITPMRPPKPSEVTLEDAMYARDVLFKAYAALGLNIKIVITPMMDPVQVAEAEKALVTEAAKKILSQGYETEQKPEGKN